MTHVLDVHTVDEGVAQPRLYARCGYLLVLAIDSIAKDNTFHWSLSCHGQQVEPSKCPQLYALASSLSSVTLLEYVLTWISCLSVCVGNADQKFSAVADARNGQFLNSSGMFNTHIVNIVAY